MKFEFVTFHSIYIIRKVGEQFHLKHQLPAVFIDTFYNENDEDEDIHFMNNTMKLWELAEGKKDQLFHCRDINAVLGEVMQLKER